MTTFDDREEAFENKFAHDEELLFHAAARRNKMVGAWAAAKLGKKGVDIEVYIQEVIISDFERPGDGDVVEKLLKDFSEAKLPIGMKEIRAEMDRCMEIAKKQVLGEEK